MVVRRACTDDLEAVLALDRACSPVYPRREAYAAQLIAPQLLLVGVDRNAVLAFASWSVVLDEASLVNLAVHGQHRREGFARRLLGESLRLLGPRGIRRLLLEVRESNAAARRLYEASGFAVDGLRRDYYPGSGGEREAAVLMSRAVAPMPA